MKKYRIRLSFEHDVEASSKEEARELANHIINTHRVVLLSAIGSPDQLLVECVTSHELLSQLCGGRDVGWISAK